MAAFSPTHNIDLVPWLKWPFPKGRRTSLGSPRGGTLLGASQAQVSKDHGIVGGEVGSGPNPNGGVAPIPPIFKEFPEGSEMRQIDPHNSERAGVLRVRVLSQGAEPR